jgi:anti-sigma factor ChrR (cupin superfamily)
MNVRSELASRFVDVQNMPWEKTAYAGIVQKTLLVDKSTGLITALMKLDPGATLPDHEHVKIEQT